MWRGMAVPPSEDHVRYSVRYILTHIPRDLSSIYLALYRRQEMHHYRHAHGCGPGWQSAGRRGSFGAFGRGFGPSGPNFGRGGGLFSIGRVLAGGDLRLIVLALLEESPRHGYEIIKELEEKSSGFYSPSP